MRSCTLHRILFVFVLSCLSILVASPRASAQTQTLFVWPDSVLCVEGQTGVTLPIYMHNLEDSVAGFSIFLQLDRPGVCSLSVDFDTTGCLTNGWQLLEVVDLSSHGTGVKISGLSNMFEPPFRHGIGPQTGDAPLIKLLFDVFDPIDPISGNDVLLHIPTVPVNLFEFADPQANPIGRELQEVQDSMLFRCTEWFDEDICLWWERVSLPPYDSVFYYIDTVAVFMDEVVSVEDGWIHVANPVCGDFNGSEAVDISDLTGLIGYLFLEGPEPYYPPLMNVNGSLDGTIDISDLTMLVNHLFLQGGPLACLE